MSKPVMHYFDISGRGELAKLIAAVGGLEIDVVEYAFDLANPEADYKKAAVELGMPKCGLPIVVHDDLKISQSSSVQSYFASIGPNYPKVNPQQQAVDDMFAGVFEDVMGAGAAVLLAGAPPQKCGDALDKALPVLCNYIKDDGFINGFDAPTCADLCIFILVEGLIPFGAATSQIEGGYDWNKFSKAKALSDRVKDHPAVAAWLTNKDCMLKNPPGGKKEKAVEDA